MTALNVVVPVLLKPTQKIFGRIPAHRVFVGNSNGVEVSPFGAPIASDNPVPRN
jgi:hypothetical protein